MPLKVPLKDIQLQSCFVETATLAEALLNKTYVLSADSPISLEDKVSSCGAVRGIKDAINTGNCVKYFVENEVIVVDITLLLLIIADPHILLGKNWAPDGSCFQLYSDTVHQSIGIHGVW